jgi:hypothetical protein
MPFEAVIVIWKFPAKLAVPAMVAVPLWLSTNVTPPGKEPVSVKLGVGVPLVVTVNEFAIPAMNVALLVLVIDGGVPVTVRPALPLFPEWMLSVGV